MKIVIPSMGRCGSSLLVDIVRAAFPELLFVFHRSMREFPEEGIIKTHCWAPKELPEDGKYVYIYGDPLLSAISVHQLGEDFQKQHYIHMGAAYDLKELWPLEDVLHLRQNFKSWESHQGKTNLLMLRFDDLFSHEKMQSLGEFLGVKINAQELKPRKTIVDPSNEVHMVAKKTYAELLK
jgi:hypothetical protein